MAFPAPKPRRSVRSGSGGVTTAKPSGRVLSDPDAKAGHPDRGVPLKKLDVDAIHGKVKKLLKFSTFIPERKYWLDTGSPHMNAAMGSEEKGLPYGKIFEIAGEEHSGKSTLALILAGIAQKEGAAAGLMDVEDSRDASWSRRMGVDYSQMVLVKKRLMKRGKHSPPSLKTAEEMFAEMETAMHMIYRQGFKKQIWIVDSIANLQPAIVVKAGVMGQNLRTNVERAQFLSTELPRLAGLASGYNAMILLINHLRERPGTVFGDPLYTPGGRGIRHACRVRVRVRRHKHGELRNMGKVVGIIGIVRNLKNNSGGGSVQSRQAGFKIRWDRDPAQVTFMSKEDAQELL